MAVVVLGPAAQTASAATVENSNLDGGHGLLEYTAEPGETNDLSLEIVDGRISVRDPGATRIRAGVGCRTTAGAVSCKQYDFQDGEVTLKDGDDRFVRRDRKQRIQFSSVAGGEGDDTLDAVATSLSGGAGDDRLTSDEESASISGGPGTDRLRGKGDNQTLIGGTGADVIDAGKGDSQTLSYAGQDEGVVVDLRKLGQVGPPSEQDTVSGEVSGIVGSKGDDRLIGTNHRDILESGGGDDTILALGGNDYIDPGHGADTVEGGNGDDRIEDGREKAPPGGDLDGGEGNDEIQARQTGAAVSGGDGDDELFVDEDTPSVACGSGDDRVKGLGKRDVPADCETSD